jgi:hypothetical protein
MERHEADKLAEQVRCQLAGRVQDLRVLPRDNGLVLQGRCRSHHAKQLAQHLVVTSTQVPLLANEIVVLCRCGMGPDDVRPPDHAPDA